MLMSKENLEAINAENKRLIERGINGEFKRNNIKYSQRELILALLGYTEKKCLTGKKNPNFKNGKNNEYVRIVINGRKVKRSHIVWMLWNNKSKVPDGFDIHHKNGNKKDDSPRNLKLEKSVYHGIKNLKNQK